MKRGMSILLALTVCLGFAAMPAWAESPWSTVNESPWQKNAAPPPPPTLVKPWQGRPGGAAPYSWVTVREGRIPASAVQGGQDQGAPIYICRAQYQNGIHAGKVVNRRCNFGWGGREVVLNDYQVLVERQGVRWVAQGQGVPRGAVLAGRVPGGDLYVCRASHGGGTHIGKLFNGKCNIGWGGQEVSLGVYQVLIAPGSRWLRVPPGQIPAGAVGGGLADNTEMYVCRGFYNDGQHPGKTWQGRCNIGWGGQEVALTHYDVLVKPNGLSWLPAGQAANRRCLTAGQAGQETQCVCRANFRGGVHPGKTWHGRCNIGWGGQEFPLGDYEVLVTD